MWCGPPSVHRGFHGLRNTRAHPNKAFSGGGAAPNVAMLPSLSKLTNMIIVLLLPTGLKPSARLSAVSQKAHQTFVETSVRFMLPQWSQRACCKKHAMSQEAHLHSALCFCLTKTHRCWIRSLSSQTSLPWISSDINKANKLSWPDVVTSLTRRHLKVLISNLKAKFCFSISVNLQTWRGATSQ